MKHDEGGQDEALYSDSDEEEMALQPEDLSKGEAAPLFLHALTHSLTPLLTHTLTRSLTISLVLCFVPCFNPVRLHVAPRPPQRQPHRQPVFSTAHTGSKPPVTASGGDGSSLSAAPHVAPHVLGSHPRGIDNQHVAHEPTSQPQPQPQPQSQSQSQSQFPPRPPPVLPRPHPGMMVTGSNPYPTALPLAGAFNSFNGPYGIQPAPAPHLLARVPLPTHATQAAANTGLAGKTVNSANSGLAHVQALAQAQAQAQAQDKSSMAAGFNGFMQGAATVNGVAGAAGSMNASSSSSSSAALIANAAAAARSMKRGRSDETISDGRDAAPPSSKIKTSHEPQHVQQS